MVLSSLYGSIPLQIGNKDFKIIYGVEAYLVDDLKRIIENPGGQNFDDTYVIFDLETTVCRLSMIV